MVEFSPGPTKLPAVLRQCRATSGVPGMAGLWGLSAQISLPPASAAAVGFSVRSTAAPVGQSKVSWQRGLYAADCGVCLLDIPLYFGQDLVPGDGQSRGQLVQRCVCIVPRSPVLKRVLILSC